MELVRKVVRTLAAVALTAAFLVPVTPARAQEEKVVREADKVVYRKKQVIDFSDVTIQGELTRPEGTYILNRKKAKFNLLIRVRETFLPEMLRSVDHL
jgi:hypothetical protein